MMASVFSGPWHCRMTKTCGLLLCLLGPSAAAQRVSEKSRALSMAAGLFQKIPVLINIARWCVSIMSEPWWLSVWGRCSCGSSRSQLESNYVHFCVILHWQNPAVLLQVIEGTSMWHRQFQLVLRLLLIGTTWKEIKTDFSHSLKASRITG